MRVLVTGASGLLGRTTAARVRDAGHDVRTFQRRASGVDGVEDHLGSVTDHDAVERAVRGVDAVVHLAAKVSLAGDPADFRRVNVDGTRALLAAAARHGVDDVVHVSSPSVAHTGTAIVGEEAPRADPLRTRGAYARTKAEGELLALDADGDLRVVAVRPHLVWGPGDEQLVGRIAARARAGRLPLLGHGAALIDTTYLDNAASALVAALHRLGDGDGAVRGHAYVVTNGEPRTVAEMVGAICAAVGAPAPTYRVPGALARGAGAAVEAVWGRFPLHGADGEPPMTRFLAEQLSTAHWFDQRRARVDLRWRPEVSVDDGLRLLTEWHAAASGTPSR